METTCTTLNKTELQDLNKSQLIDLLVYADALSKTKGRKPKGKTVKEKVYDIIKRGPVTIDAIAKELGTNNKNISSNKRYLILDGCLIGKSSQNELVLENPDFTPKFNK